MITTLYENTTQLAIRILTILLMKAHVVNVCQSKIDPEGVEFCSNNELDKFYQDQWDTICLTIWTLLSVIIKIWLLRQEHKRIRFDITFYEFCMHLLTINMNRVPFICGLRNWTFLKTKEDEFNPGMAMNYQK